MIWCREDGMKLVRLYCRIAGGVPNVENRGWFWDVNGAELQG